MWIIIIIVVIILISIIAKIFEWLRDNIGKILLVIGIIVAISILIYLIGTYPDVMKTVGIVVLWIIGAVVAITLAILVISSIKSAVEKAVRERQKRLEAERIRREEERQRIIKSAFEKTQMEVENFIITNKSNDAKKIYSSLSETLAHELVVLKHENCVDNAYDEKMIVAFFCKASVTYYFLKKLLRDERGFTREGAVEYCRSNQLMFERIDDDISQMLAENLIKKIPMGSKDVLFSSNLPGKKMKSIEINCD